MSLDRDIAFLARIPMFGALSNEQLKLIAFSAVRKAVAADEVLFETGAPADSGFVVISGEIALIEPGGGPDAVTLCEAGSLIGELALVIETKRPATAKAIRPSEVLEISRALFSRMLNEYPHVAWRLRVLLADRLTATVSELGKVHTVLKTLELPKGQRSGG
jgi:CRP-like cAMP-binding protein